MQHDAAFKRLISALPAQALTAFADGLCDDWGPPQSVEFEPSEVLPRIPGVRRSRFFDVAMRFVWPDGRQRIVLLVEHWSRTRQVDLARVLIYTAELARRHPGVAILPVLVVSDAESADAVGHRLAWSVGDLPVLVFQARVLAVRGELLQRFRQRPNPVLGVLAALLHDLPPVELALRATRMVVQVLPERPISLLETLLHLVRVFANMKDIDVERFHQHLEEEPDMLDIVEVLKAKGKAEGKAEGRIETLIATLRGFVAEGVITVDQGRARVRAMQAAGEIDAETAQQTLKRLG